MPGMASELLKAPWSNQRVSMVVRIGAWFFVLCGIVALVSATYLSAIKGVRYEDLWVVLVMYPGILYFLWLFGHVALRGQAPPGWLPRWRK